jgi:hypothetical protein
MVDVDGRELSFVMTQDAARFSGLASIGDYKLIVVIWLYNNPQFKSLSLLPRRRD